MRVGARTLVLLASCAAAAAAAFAHIVIDFIGDYALSSDSYDHLRHDSRDLVSGIALLLAVVLAGRGLRACCDVAAFNRSRILAPAHGLNGRLGFILAAVAGSAALVPAMECLDGRLAGVPVRALGDAFGGSALLGVVTTVLCATAVALLVFGVARWLVSHRDSIAAMIETLLRRSTVNTVPSSCDLAGDLFTPRRRRTTPAQRLSKRGPPELLFT